MKVDMTGRKTKRTNVTLDLECYKAAMLFAWDNDDMSLSEVLNYVLSQAFEIELPTEGDVEAPDEPQEASEPDPEPEDEDDDESDEEGAEDDDEEVETPRRSRRKKTTRRRRKTS